MRIWYPRVAGITKSLMDADDCRGRIIGQHLAKLAEDDAVDLERLGEPERRARVLGFVS